MDYYWAKFVYFAIANYFIWGIYWNRYGNYKSKLLYNRDRDSHWRLLSLWGVLMRYELNVTTGELVDRLPPAEEIAQAEKDRAAAIMEESEGAAAESARAAVEESARAKLAAVGLTEEEIAALVG